VIKETFEQFKRRLHTSQIDFDQLANWYWQEHQGISETVVHRSQYDQMCEGFERRIRALERDLEKTDDKEVETLDQIRDAMCDIQRNPDRCCRILQGILEND